MKIEHIALYVQDLQGAAEFFRTYFGGETSALYHNPHSDFQSVFLRFEDGARLELMTKPGLSDSGNCLDRFGYAHIALSVGSMEAVDQLTAKLTQAGYHCISGPRTTGDGYYESCIVGFEGNLIEITV